MPTKSGVFLQFFEFRDQALELESLVCSSEAVYYIGNRLSRFRVSFIVGELVILNDRSAVVFPLTKFIMDVPGILRLPFPTPVSLSGLPSSAADSQATSD